jgi:hypothetical protein
MFTLRMGIYPTHSMKDNCVGVLYFLVDRCYPQVQKMSREKAYGKVEA